MRVRAYLWSFALLAAGCSGPTGSELRDGTNGLIFQAERPQYVHGETAVIILRNETSEPIGYNLCLSMRERKVGRSWHAVEPAGPCQLIMWGLNPGQEARLEKRIEPDWEPGKYRMVTSVSLTGTAGEVVAAEFSVARD